MNFARLKSIYDLKWYQIMDVKPGQYLEIFEKVWEWQNQRIWKFKWLVINVKKPNNIDGAFTIRWKTSWITIEKIYPLSFPNFEKVELLDEYKIRRAKLYYLREKIWKDARMKSKIVASNRWKDLSIKKIQVDNTTNTETA